MASAMKEKSSNRRQEEGDQNFQNLDNQQSNKIDKESIKSFIVSKYPLLEKLFNCWHGLGEFNRIPTEGSFDALEKHSTKWRKHFTNSQVKYFTEAKTIIVAIHSTAEKDGVEVEEVLVEWEDAFQNESKGCLSKMVYHLQASGIVSKRKPRGRAAAD